MKHIFVYGTLLNDEILEELLSFVPEKISATLFGYKRVQVKEASYPAIFPQANCSVDGILLRGLNNQHIEILDNYETPYYKKEQVEIVFPDDEKIHSQAYVYKAKYYQHLSDEPWSNDHFRTKFLHR